MTPKFSTLIEVIKYHATHQANKTAFIFLQDGEVESERLTYKELDQHARRIANHLREITYPGERALLLYPSGPNFIVSFIGCLYAGIVAVPAYPPRRNQKLSRLESIVSDSTPSVILTDTSTLNNLKKQWVENSKFSDLPCVATDQPGAILAEYGDLPLCSPDTLAFLQYTSGSTGQPKGVMITHENIVYNQEMIKTAFAHNNTTICLGWLPLFHDMGLIGNVLHPLYMGFHCVLMSPDAFLQKPIRWLQAISRYQATTSGGPNFAYEHCIKRISTEQKKTIDLSCWTLAFNGAEPIRAKTLEKFSQTFAECGFQAEAAYPCYGMAETTLLVSGGLPKRMPSVKNVQTSGLKQHQAVTLEQSQPDSCRIVSSGQSVLEQNIVIVDPTTHDQCPDGNVGEIWVSGKNVAAGYWNQPAATEETFNAYLKDSLVGPFLRTGDLGFLIDGELYITGRIKDVLIIRGRNHYPQDIEQTVQQTHQALRRGRGAAFTVQLDDKVRLVIVQEIERTYLRKLDVQATIAEIKRSIVVHHGLQAYEVILIKPGRIPLTSSGKIQRYRCRTGYLDGDLNAIHDWGTASSKLQTQSLAL